MLPNLNCKDWSRRGLSSATAIAIVSIPVQWTYCNWKISPYTLQSFAVHVASAAVWPVFDPLFAQVHRMIMALTLSYFKQLLEAGHLESIKEDALQFDGRSCVGLMLLITFFSKWLYLINNCNKKITFLSLAHR